MCAMCVIVLSGLAARTVKDRRFVCPCGCLDCRVLVTCLHTFSGFSQVGYYSRPHMKAVHAAVCCLACWILLASPVSVALWCLTAHLQRRHTACLPPSSFDVFLALCCSCTDVPSSHRLHVLTTTVVLLSGPQPHPHGRPPIKTLPANAFIPGCTLCPAPTMPAWTKCMSRQNSPD